MDPLDGQLLDVVVLRVLRRVPDQPQEKTVEEVVACQRGDAHVEEDALQHGPRQELQHRGEEQRTPNEDLLGCPLSPLKIIYDYGSLQNNRRGN